MLTGQGKGEGVKGKSESRPFEPSFILAGEPSHWRPESARLKI
jgi:hypothetical protein